MANLTENTSYDPSTQAPMANFSGLIKSMAVNAHKKSSDTSHSAINSQFAPPPAPPEPNALPTPSPAPSPSPLIPLTPPVSVRPHLAGSNLPPVAPTVAPTTTLPPGMVLTPLTKPLSLREAIINDAMRSGDFDPPKDKSAKKPSKEKKDGKGGLYDGQGGPKKAESDKFVVIRHGATANNEKGINRGMLNINLSKLGVEQTMNAVKKLKNMGITALISSPLKRTKDTAEIISKNTGIPVIGHDKALLPWNLGEFHGKSIKDTLPALHHLIENPDVKTPGKGESFNTFKERSISGLKKIHEKHPNEKLGLVTHHRVERLVEAHANENEGHGIFDKNAQKQKGIEPGDIKEHKWDHLFPKKKSDGKGGLFDGLSNLFSSTTTYTRPPDGSGSTNSSDPNSPTYNVRGLKVNDNDINEASNILYGEISNRDPNKQQFETRNAINTAINRANSNPKQYGGSLTKVLQAPNQYQSYAPNGVTGSKRQVIQSQYQKIKSGLINPNTDPKYQTIKNTLMEMKSGKFPDTTQGKQFYVHASDGSMWLGKTVSEAKKLANQREKELNIHRTSWRNAPGPVQVAQPNAQMASTTN